jgi:hypothetical protein
MWLLTVRVLTEGSLAHSFNSGIPNRGTLGLLDLCTAALTTAPCGYDVEDYSTKWIIHVYKSHLALFLSVEDISLSYISSGSGHFFLIKENVC